MGLLMISAIFLAPLGVTWTCHRCQEGEASYDSDMVAGSRCVGTQVIRLGFAAAAVIGIAQALLARYISGQWRSAIIMFFLNAMVSNWILCALTASFLCSGADVSASWYRSIPFLVLVLMSVGHTAIITRGKLMPGWYRGTFAVAYSILTTASLMVFFFSPGIAAISNPFLAALPFVVGVLLSLVGVHQSWSSPRPLEEWELVNLDLTAIFATVVTADSFDNTDDTSRVVEALDVPRKTLGAAIASESSGSSVSGGWTPTQRTSLTLRDGADRGWLQGVQSKIALSRKQRGDHQGGTSDEDSVAARPPLPVSEAGTSSSTNGDVLTIFQITDPHLGSYMTPKRLRLCCERALELDPDIVLLTGDFFTAEAHEEPKALYDAFAPLMRLPRGRVFACFGNHDLEAPRVRELVVNTMSDLGVILLCDEGTVVRTRAGLVELVGLNYTMPRFDLRKSIEDAFALDCRFQSSQNHVAPKCRFVNPQTSLGKISAIGEYVVHRENQGEAHEVSGRSKLQQLASDTAEPIRQTIVMLHDPQGFRWVPRLTSSGSGALVFSGHTHGGHIGLYNFGLKHATILSMVGFCDNGVWTCPRTGNVSYIHRGQGARSLMSQAIVRLGVPSEDSVLRVKLPPQPAS